MGTTEYAIRLPTIKNAEHVIEVINAHNTHDDFDEVGEEIYITGYLNFNDECYMVATNGGGRSYTSEWFDCCFMPEIEWYGMCDKPEGWYECEDYIWESKSERYNENKEIHTVPKDVIDFISAKKSTQQIVNKEGFTSYNIDNKIIYISDMCLESYPCQHDVYFNNDNEGTMKFGDSICELFENSNCPIPEHFINYK
jgi:hypothetical protein